ncbi:hypothetical protein ACPV4B_19135 [Vibrio parahaemolyticus]
MSNKFSVVTNRLVQDLIYQLEASMSLVNDTTNNIDLISLSIDELDDLKVLIKYRELLTRSHAKFELLAAESLSSSPGEPQGTDGVHMLTREHFIEKTSMLSAEVAELIEDFEGDFKGYVSDINLNGYTWEDEYDFKLVMRIVFINGDTVDVKVVDYNHDKNHALEYFDRKIEELFEDCISSLYSKVDAQVDYIKPNFRCWY